MHFWIDKRSQCAYTGRHRVPSSLSSGKLSMKTDPYLNNPIWAHRHTKSFTVTPTRCMGIRMDITGTDPLPLAEQSIFKEANEMKLGNNSIRIVEHCC